MVPKHAVTIIGFLLFSMLAASLAIAQPMLPDITGVAEKGTVSLSWNCQYSNVKAISVLRATDSFADFSLIGYVEKVTKGPQTFTDPHPLPGKNCYKAVVGFKSGLTWRSNHYCIFVERYALESEKASGQNPNTKIQNPNPDKTTEAAAKPATPQLKLPTRFSDTMENPGTFIKSRFIFADSKTGHVDVLLPDDVSDHHYSLKFFDSQNHTIFDVPWVNTNKFIIDKRNFQRKGVYKFVLRKDYVELEEGYVEVKNPNP